MGDGVLPAPPPAGPSSCPDEPRGETLALLTFIRSPDSFRRVLDTAPELEPWRWPLHVHELPTQLSGGARVLVAPEMFEDAMRLLDQNLDVKTLRPRHVLVTPDAEAALIAVCRLSIPGHQRVKVKEAWRWHMPLKSPPPSSRWSFCGLEGAPRPLEFLSWDRLSPWPGLAWADSQSDGTQMNAD